MPIPGVRKKELRKADPASLLAPAAPMGMDLVRLAEVGSQHAPWDRRPRFAALSMALLVAPVIVKNGRFIVVFLAKNIMPERRPSLPLAPE